MIVVQSRLVAAEDGVSQRAGGEARLGLFGHGVVFGGDDALGALEHRPRVG